MFLSAVREGEMQRLVEGRRRSVQAAKQQQKQAVSALLAVARRHRSRGVATPAAHAFAGVSVRRVAGAYLTACCTAVHEFVQRIQDCQHLCAAGHFDARTMTVSFCVFRAASPRFDHQVGF